MFPFRSHLSFVASLQEREYFSADKGDGYEYLIINSTFTQPQVVHKM